MDESLLVQLGAIVVLGIGAQWLAWRLNLPAILLLLLAGLSAGPLPEWLGLPRLVDPEVLLGATIAPAVSLSVAVILFEGGLSLRLGELRASGVVIRNLVSIGAVITWGIAAVAAKLCVGLPWSLSILLGAILVVTGPTVIGPLLRHVRPAGSVGPILMWEGIVIDPIGALLAVLVFEVIVSLGGEGPGIVGVIGGGIMTVVVGGVMGVVGAVAMVRVLRRFWLPDYLHNPAALMFVVGAFVAADLIRSESGLLAVTVMGLVLANQRSVAVRHIAEFKESLTILLVSVLFVTLSARLTPEQIVAAGPGSIAFTLVLILVARPVSVLAATVGSGLSIRERAFLMAMAPRGIVAAAVASVFALRLGESGIEGADRLVPATFTVIIGTVAVYGLGSGFAARRLGLTGGRVGFLIAGANPVSLAIGRALKQEEVPVLLVDTRTDRLAPIDHSGIPTLHTSVLSPFLRERIDPGRIGRLLAMTPNEEVNSLATLHFAGLFGRENVYQLTPEPHDAAKAPGNGDIEPEAAEADESIGAHLDAAETTEPGRAVALELHGRVLFGSNMTYLHLERLLSQGAQVVRLDRDEGVVGDLFEAFHEQHGEDAVPLLAVGVDEVSPVAVGHPLDGASARAIIGLTLHSRSSAAGPS